MKNYWLLFAVIGLISCGEKEAEMPADYKISGEILNYDGDEILLFHTAEKPDTIKLNEDGSFDDNFGLSEPGKIPFQLGRDVGYYYVEPGDSLHIKMDMNSFPSSLDYIGSNPEGANFLKEILVKEYEISKSYNPREAFLLSEEDFLGLVDSLLYIRNKILDNWKEKAPKSLIEERELVQQYKWALAIQQFERGMQWVKGNDSLTVSDEFLKTLEAVPLENEKALDIREYQQYVETNIQEQMMSENDSLYDLDFEDYYTLQMETTASMLSDPAVKDFFVTSVMKDMVDFEGASDLGEMMSKYESIVSDEKLKTEVRAAYAEWDHLRSGKPAPDFSYKNLEGEEVALSDFKDKVVYVDVWATWCGPCLGQLPHLEELEEEMAGNDVVFISVSVDESYEDWETMVTEDEMKGVQLITGTGWKSGITEDYKISGIPRFILVDREGNIVSASAPRPSSGEEIRKMIREALNQKDALAVVQDN